MRWERFFDDLEDQLAAEWEAERAALESEAERLRVARLDLRSRLAGLAGEAEGPVALELLDGFVRDVRISAVGADWIAAPEAADARRMLLVPIGAIRGIQVGHGDLLRSARPAETRDRLAERVTFALALRDLSRRRVGVAVGVAAAGEAGAARTLTGTIDRVGADHLDLAMHDAGAPRRAADVRGYRMLPLAGVAWVRVDAGAGAPVV
ncbi:hypothetical protein [Microbacterium sp. NPDC096154]|uniref:hypothetical protein n=1 Tax=Microbacterium sp. NPDC096154 TaxID=3155549 RepID=UPI00332147EF